MEPEGMVHALGTIHQLLNVDGILVDIHPSTIPANIFVQAGSALIQAGIVEELDEYVEYQQAEQALSVIVQGGLFKIENRALFRCYTYAKNLNELNRYFSECWSDACLSAQTLNNIQKALGPSKDSGRILLSERIWISRLAPMTRQPA